MTSVCLSTCRCVLLALAALLTTSNGKKICLKPKDPLVISNPFPTIKANDKDNLGVFWVKLSEVKPSNGTNSTTVKMQLLTWTPGGWTVHDSRAQVYDTWGLKMTGLTKNDSGVYRAKIAHADQNPPPNLEVSVEVSSTCVPDDDGGDEGDGGNGGDEGDGNGGDEGDGGNGGDEGDGGNGGDEGDGGNGGDEGDGGNGGDEGDGGNGGDEGDGGDGTGQLEVSQLLLALGTLLAAIFVY